MSRVSWHVSSNKGGHYLLLIPFLLSDVICVNTVRTGQQLVRRVVKVERKHIFVKNALNAAHDF